MHQEGVLLDNIQMLSFELLKHCIIAEKKNMRETNVYKNSNPISNKLSPRSIDIIFSHSSCLPEKIR
jgi:hypothetical protein